MSKKDYGDVTRAALVPRKASAVTPHASDPLTTSIPLAFETQAVWVGVSGTLVVRFSGDSADTTLSGVIAGVWHPMSVTHIRSTSTATSIVIAIPG